MKKRAFFVLSLSLAILGLSAQLWAMGFTSRSLHMRTRAITGPQEERSQGIAEAKKYLRLFPSLNASWNLRENLVARAAYYSSVGRPDFNQYAGGVTLPVDCSKSCMNPQ